MTRTANEREVVYSSTYPCCLPEKTPESVRKASTYNNKVFQLHDLTNFTHIFLSGEKRANCFFICTSKLNSCNKMAGSTIWTLIWYIEKEPRVFPVQARKPFLDNSCSWRWLSKVKQDNVHISCNPNFLLLCNNQSTNFTAITSPTSTARRKKY